MLYKSQYSSSYLLLFRVFPCLCNQIFGIKVLSLLEACFDLTSSPSLPWKFKSWAWKLLKICGSNPRSERSKKFLSFSVHFQILHKNCTSLCLTIFLISCFTNQISIKTNIFNIQKGQKCLTFRSWDLNPRFSVIFPPTIWIFKVGATRSNLGKQVKISRLYLLDMLHQSEFVGMSSRLQNGWYQAFWYEESP